MWRWSREPGRASARPCPAGWPTRARACSSPTWTASGPGRTAREIRGDGGEAEALACDVADAGRARRPSPTPSRASAGSTSWSTTPTPATPTPRCSRTSPTRCGTGTSTSPSTGAFRCARAALPHLAAADGRGAIVNVGSVNGIQDFGNHAYSAAKAGLASLTRTLAGHAAARGVRVNLVAPGTIRTPGLGGPRGGAGRRSPASIRWAGSASRTTSPPPSPSWPPPTPPGSPA